MAILLFLVPISLLLVIAAVWAFVAAVRGGQFDDLDTPPLDILREDDAPFAPPAQAPGDDAPRHDHAD